MQLVIREFSHFRWRIIRNLATYLPSSIKDWVIALPQKAWKSSCSWLSVVWTLRVKGGLPWVMWWRNWIGYWRKRWAWQQSWEKELQLWLLEASFLGLQNKMQVWELSFFVVLILWFVWFVILFTETPDWKERCIQLFVNCKKEKITAVFFSSFILSSHKCTLNLVLNNYLLIIDEDCLEWF